MKTITMDTPPNPMDQPYRSNPLAYNRAMYDWMMKMKQKIESASLQNDTPMAQPFVVSSFTTNTTLTGTATGTDVSDFVCTLVQAMINKGFVTSKGG